MKVGSLRMIQKRSDKAFNGKVPDQHEDVEVEDEVNVHRIFYISGIVHMEFLPQGTTVNQHVYKEILRRLIVSVWTKRRDRYENNDWLLHHDNALSHNALNIRQFITEQNVTMLDQPPYSPDLAPCNFLNSLLFGHHLSNYPPSQLQRPEWVTSETKRRRMEALSVLRQN